MKSPRIAIVYDRVNKWGGAEQILLSLHRLFPQAPLYTSVFDPKGAPWVGKWAVHTSFVQHLPFAKNHHQAYVMFMPYAFESLNLDNYDIIISVTSAEAKGIITKPNQLHLSYLLTPTRYLWSHTHQYRYRNSHPTLLLPFMSHLRRWDYIAAQRPNLLVPISHHVSARIRKYYHRDPLPVIYPPVATQVFSFHPPTCFHPQSNYFLIVSRLVAYKSIDIVLSAFRQLPHEKLLIVGVGDQLETLKEQAPNNVTFMGLISPNHLNCLYHHANALIFPQEEDFGITAVEAQAAGIPVIAYHQDGAKETIIAGKSGVFFDQPTPDSLIMAIHTWKTHTWYDRKIQAHAKKFDEKIFSESFKQLVEESWRQATLKP